MQFRSLIRIFAASLLAYSVLCLAPRYTAEQCSKSELRGTAPCVAFFAAQDAFYSRAGKLAEKAHTYPQVQSLTKKYNELELERHFAKGINSVRTQWNNVVKPRALKLACQSAQFTVRYSSEYYNKAATFSKNTALPLLRKNGQCALTWVRQQLQALWVRIETSRYWEDVIVPQALKIYDTVRNRAMQEQGGREATTVGEPSATATQALNRGSSSLLDAEASASSSAEAHSSASASSSSSIIAASAASASLASESEASLSSAAASATSNSKSSASSEAVPTAKQWANKAKRNIDFAIKSLQEDAIINLDNAVDAAKPEIMGLLRDIAAYGEVAVKEVGNLAAQVKSESETSQVSKQDIYDAYDLHLKALADMAFKVRDRSEKLAHDSLEGLNPVRLVTLDAVDDYFDAILTEAAREMTIKDEWTGWKDYHEFKQTLSELRSTVENYEFDMTVVNTALRESQSASIILVQQYNQKLADLRAECQLIFQKRESSGEAQAADKEQNSAEDLDSEAEAVETTETTEPIEDSSDHADQESAKLERSSQEHAETEAVDSQLEQPAVNLPFDDNVNFEDSEIIETDFETQVYTV